MGGLNAKIEVVRYEEDEDGDEEGVWYLTADVSECDGEKVALRVGFEDGFYSADWDFADLLAEHEDKDDFRELCVYGVEEGDLLTVELRIAEKTSLSEEFSIKNLKMDAPENISEKPDDLRQLVAKRSSSESEDECVQ